MRVQLCILVLLIVNNSYGQQLWNTLNSGGQSVSTTDVHLDWAIGQIASAYVSTNDLQLDQGFVQLLQSGITTNIANPEISIDFRAFPNPSSEYVVLNTTIDQQVKYEIINAFGIRLDSGYFRNRHTLSTRYYDAGPYFIVLRTENRLVGVYPLVVQ